MMKFINYILIISLFISSCKKKEGCTDPIATNYNLDAEKNDGSCIYINGCMDSEATNYNAAANMDDASCFYICLDQYAVNYQDTSSVNECEFEADVVFYLEEASSDYFVTNTNILFLDIFNGNDIIGNLSTSQGFTNGIYCDSTNQGLVHYKYKWQNTQNSNFSWIIRDGIGEIIYQGDDPVLPNNCLSINLPIPIN